MTDLLVLALEAHGGLERWNSFRSLRAEVAIGGMAWHVEPPSDRPVDKIVALDTHEPHLTITPFTHRDTRSVFVPDRLVVQSLAGDVVNHHPDPAALFVDDASCSHWSVLKTVWFASGALWITLVSPFMYSYPGFIAEEIEPWHENDEQWRRLRVTFPDRIASHAREHVTHFGPDGLIRRQDYTVDILGGARCINYASGYRRVQGIAMPTVRRIHGRGAAPALVSMDFTSLAFS